MSLYSIHKFLCQLRNDEAYRRAAQADPAAALDALQLTAEERGLLERGDVRGLYEMGVHAYLLQQLSSAELFGVNRQNYFPRIRGEVAAPV
jgi:Aromatic-ring-opening dioxygenase LigAB, LigA subunit